MRRASAAEPPKGLVLSRILPTFLSAAYADCGWKGISIAEGVIDFVGAILEHRPPAVDPLDGYYPLKVVEHAYASVALAGQSLSQ
ncbi:MAG TPA: hypothetical protein VHB98_08400 [Chloroflexota bacterium]|jgi:hypothetical protein|nr:hypothetical protein [Chloroflexota bacterium]